MAFDDISRRQALRVLALAGGEPLAQVRLDGNPRPGSGPDGGRGAGGPALDVESASDVPVYHAPTADDLAEPSETPAVAVTDDAGMVIATAGGYDAFTTLSETAMTEVQEIHVATTVDDLDEPDAFPALAVTTDEGVLVWTEAG